jgi:hypothetical protein
MFTNGAGDALSADAVNVFSITHAGAVTVGPASGLTANHLIQNSASSGYCLQVNNSAASAPSGLVLNFSAASPDNNTQYFLQCSDSTTPRCFIYSDGDVWTSDSGTLTSDERLKTNINPATPKLADVLRVQVKNFEWTEEYHPSKVGQKKIGFIAQEFEEIFPGLVSENTFEMSGEEVTRKSIRYGAMIPILTKAIQELSAKLDAANAEISALKAA